MPRTKTRNTRPLLNCDKIKELIKDKKWTVYSVAETHRLAKTTVIPHSKKENEPIELLNLQVTK